MMLEHLDIRLRQKMDFKKTKVLWQKDIKLQKDKIGFIPHNIQHKKLLDEWRFKCKKHETILEKNSG